MRFEAMVDGRTMPVEVRPSGQGYRVRLGERALDVEMRAARPGFVSFFVDGLSVEAGIERQGDVYTVHLPERTLQVSLAEGPSAREGPTAAAAGPLRVEAPMPGRVVRLLVEEGQEVAAGQGLLVMEAMKMENELRAPRASRVAAVRVRAPCAVETGALLVVLE